MWTRITWAITKRKCSGIAGPSIRFRRGGTFQGFGICDIAFYLNRPRLAGDLHGTGGFLLAGAEIIRVRQLVTRRGGRCLLNKNPPRGG